MGTAVWLICLAATAAGAAWAWRRYPSEDNWLGPALAGWKMARRAAFSLAWGTTGGTAAGLLSGAVLMPTVGGEEAASVLRLLITVLPAVLAIHIVSAALNGPPTSAVPKQHRVALSPGCDMAEYGNRDWFFLVLEPAVLVATALVVLAATDWGTHIDPVAAYVPWAVVASIALALISVLGSVVVRCTLDSGVLAGYTMLRLRRFRYHLSELQISYRWMVSPARELLLVSHLGGPPLLLSSSGKGYEELAHRVAGHIALG